MLVAQHKTSSRLFCGVLPFSHDRAIIMNYRIDLVVLSHSFYQTEFFTHIQKPKEASHSRLAALGQFLRDPAGVDEELYVFLAKKIVREYVPRWSMDHDLIKDRYRSCWI